MSDGEKLPIVVVTGATGYIASHIVQQLLEKGYTVRATARNPSKTDTIKHLTSLSGADERLKFYAADLLDEGSFDAAVDGADVVIHTASPFAVGKVSNPQAFFIDPAVKGTKNVLTSVAKFPSVKRVVLTSSCIAVYGSPTERGENHLFTEADWNQHSTLDNDPYGLSKRLAEEAAWEMAKAQTNYKLVVVNPGLVIGPTLSGRSDSASVTILADLLNGKYRSGTAALSIGVVDVRDVARAHIEAMNNPNAQGRYICIDRSLWMMDIANILREKYPTYPLPTSVSPKFLLYIVGPLLAGLSWSFISSSIGYELRLDNQKIKSELAFEFTDIKKAILDMAENLHEYGIVAKRA
eukprot:TRINITY_DN6964_c0_g1_i1.p1 TRINITY_DN6964_c0_g1~~TRINITY_DN6964_c0_g1_i1.p1  ORF type:complete len:352 (-),score=83.49 TRINITY_DN6964_c0_g1_i1:117-1172(-)